MIRHHVQYVLDLNRGNKLRAARQLAISRSTLYRILGDESLLAGLAATGKISGQTTPTPQ